MFGLAAMAWGLLTVPAQADRILLVPLDSRPAAGQVHEAGALGGGIGMEAAMGSVLSNIIANNVIDAAVKNGGGVDVSGGETPRVDGIDAHVRAIGGAHGGAF